MPHDADLDDQLRSLMNSLRSERADQDYQREVLSTAAGRESARLRDRAVALTASDRHEEAHELLLEAVRLHPETDLGAAAGSARHDLGHSFSCRRLGVHIENLLAAERCFRASLACPSRASHPFRAVQTQRSLALCLRHRAAEHPDAEMSLRLLDDAEELLRKASATAEAVGPVGWTLAAGCFVNLGNLLMDQREDVDAALTAYRRGLELHREAAKLAPSERDEYDLNVLAAARAYFRRRRKGDTERALELVKEVLRDGNGRHIGTARLIAADAWMATKDGRRQEKALEQLEAINFSALDPEKLQHAADLFRRLKKLDQAITLLEGLIDNAIRDRSQAKADHAADEAALRAHQVAAVAARLYVEKGDHIAAFFVLENSSALRFIETASTFTWRPAEPVARELLRELRRYQADAAMLDQMASMLERAPRDFGRQILSEASAREAADPNEPDALHLLQECANDDDPVARFRRESGALLPVVNRIMTILAHQYPEASAAFGACDNILDRRGLGTLLDELPGNVLVRISLAKNLLVVATWHENGKIVTRAHRLPIGPDLWRLLEDARQPGLGSARGALTAMLERLDLSPALPEGRRERVIMLPSSGAAFLPLGALGPPGKRLLDRFDSILWLPSLYPLRSRQDAHPPRERTLIVTPGGTALRDLAVGDAGSDEVRLDDADATRSEVLDRATTADVVCFYTHGRHEAIEGPSIALTDGIIDSSDLSSRWEGAERVELWACETGVSIPPDPLTPLDVDEPFGLDFAFLGIGVRSAIGTLWEVPEIVTAAIVRRYRRHIASGSDPARALADAQRWWLVEGLPSLLGLLDGRSQQDAIEAFVSALGGEGTIGDGLETLGPRKDPSKPMDASEIQRWREHLTCPVSWAGFRFVGVPDRRPHNRWTDEHARPADEGVKQEVKRLIESVPEARESLDEWRERELNELAQRTPGSPTPEQAIAAARLFRDRIASSHAHNLLTGLAWLHEALTCEPLPAEARAGLAIEAAHLWLDLAAGESLHPVLSFPSIGVRARARAVVEGLVGDDPDLAAARARLAYLDAIVEARSDLAEATRRGLQVLGPNLGRPEVTHAAIRRATIACEILVADPGAVEGAAERALEHVSELLRLLSDGLRDGSLVGPMSRLVEVRNALAFRLDPEAEDIESYGVLTPRELVRATLRQFRRLGEKGPPAVQQLFAMFSESLGHMESALWGWPNNRMPLMTSSGTTGRAYRDLLGRYLASKARDTNDAAHVIACLQYACDLRLALRHNTMRLASASTDLREVLAEALWYPLHHRDALWTALSDATEIVELEDGIPRPPVLDPFARPAHTLQNETRSGIDATSWVLGKLCGWRTDDEEEAHTAAYQAVRMAMNRTHVAETTWEQLHEGERALAEQGDMTEEQRFSEMLDPGIVLEHNETLLRQLPAGGGILALSLDDRRGLVGACLWRDERGPGQRLVHIEDPALTELMHDLLLPRESDHTPSGGRCRERQEAWMRLDRWLAPHLHHLWGDGLTTKLHWQVLVPGSLRSLPILGLHAGQKRIASCVESLVHIPSLGFSKAPSSSVRAVRAACLLARDRDDGDTSFGEAVIETLRRAFPPDIIVDPQELRGRTIVEVDTLEGAADELASLRMYGVGAPLSLNATTAALRLEGRRELGGHNLAALRLGGCDSVELWACVAGGSDVLTPLRNDGDCLPGLAADFLASGARGVLDLAWPIPDLVKAIVCEQFGFARSKTKWGPTALRYAVFAVAGLLGEWADRARGTSSVLEALTLLDSARRWVAANIHNVDPSCIVSFADRGESPGLAGLTVPMLLEEVTHPSHLAAFRWWGL
jgi:CHAT domain-containing protein/tetratricopeptide (TPR) repeat protein